MCPIALVCPYILLSAFFLRTYFSSYYRNRRFQSSRLTTQHIISSVHMPSIQLAQRYRWRCAIDGETRMFPKRITGKYAAYIPSCSPSLLFPYADRICRTFVENGLPACGQVYASMLANPDSTSTISSVASSSLPLSCYLSYCRAISLTLGVETRLKIK